MGNAILAMHSCRETGSVADHIYTVKAFFINRYGLKSSTVTGTYQITEE